MGVINVQNKALFQLCKIARGYKLNHRYSDGPELVRIGFCAQENRTEQIYLNKIQDYMAFHLLASEW